MIGRIAEAVPGKRTARPPLLIRIDRFVKRVAVLISGVAVLLAVVALTRGISETRSLFRQNPLTNPFLLFGVAGAQLVHIAAMYLPWIRDIPAIQPVSPQNWFLLLALATSLAAVMEMHKYIRRRWD